MNKDKTGNERYRRWYKSHQREINEKRREEYQSRKENGLCPKCAIETGDGGLCDECLKKANKHNKKRLETLKNV